MSRFVYVVNKWKWTTTRLTINLVVEFPCAGELNLETHASGHTLECPCHKEKTRLQVYLPNLP